MLYSWLLIVLVKKGISSSYYTITSLTFNTRKESSSLRVAKRIKIQKFPHFSMYAYPVQTCVFRVTMVTLNIQLDYLISNIAALLK